MTIQQDSIVERRVIGLLMCMAEELTCANFEKEVDKSGISSNAFQGPGYRAIFGNLMNLSRKNVPATLNVISVESGLDFDWLLPIRNEGLESKFEHLDFFAKELVRLKKKRDLAAGLQRITADAKEFKADPDELITRSQALLEEQGFSGSEFNFGDQTLLALEARFTRAENGETERIIPTGITALDKEIGGLQSTLTIIGGLPGSGKSALVATILENLLQRGVRCGLFGLEDGTTWLHERLIAKRANIPLSAIKSGRFTKEQAVRVQNSSAQIHAYVKDLAEWCPRNGRAKPEDIVAMARNWVLNHGIKAIFVDHIGEIEHSRSRERFDLGIDETLAHLRGIAIRYDVAVVVAAHLRRDADKRGSGREAGAPLLSDFAESAYIERKARLALGVWGNPATPDLACVTILKNTSGPAGATLGLSRELEAAMINSSKGGRLCLS